VSKPKNEPSPISSGKQPKPVLSIGGGRPIDAEVAYTARAQKTVSRPDP
jgi:hypothetical protein